MAASPAGLPPESADTLELQASFTFLSSEHCGWGQTYGAHIMQKEYTYAPAQPSQQYESYVIKAKSVIIRANCLHFHPRKWGRCIQKICYTYGGTEERIT